MGTKQGPSVRMFGCTGCSLSVHLVVKFTDLSQPQTDASARQREPQNALARLTLQLFVAKTSIWNNGAIMAGVTMDNCLLDDCRPEKEGKITRCVKLCICVCVCVCVCMCVCVCVDRKSGG